MPSNDARWIIGTVIVVGGLLAAQIAGVTVGVNARLDRIETDIRGIDARLRAVEVTLAKVEQRLATLERLHLPTPAPGECAPYQPNNPATGPSVHASAVRVASRSL